MKLTTVRLFLVLISLAYGQSLFSQTSAAFEIESTTQGVLVPRMTKVQRDAILTPDTGLLLYQVDDTTGFYFYSGVVWQHLSESTNEVFLTSETDPVFIASQANNITATDITKLSNLSGTNTGDQDISGIAANTQAIKDTASQIRADVPDVSGFLTSETDPVFIASQANNITASDISKLSNLSGVNTGDQDISGIAANTQAIKDTASQIRADIPDVSGFLTSEKGVPVGGTANQVLTKVDGTDYNTAWVTPAGGADNLGDHTATQDLNMATQDIKAVDSLISNNAKLGGNNYPNITGTNGQVLQTDGAGALSWGSVSGGGATLQLKVAKSATLAQTTAIGNSMTLPDVITFDQIDANSTLTGGNTWTGNNTFTVGAGGAGLYMIQVQITAGETISTTHFTMIDMNNTGNSGSSFYAPGALGNTTTQIPHKSRSQCTGIVYMAVGDSFQVRVASGTTSIGVDITTDGSSHVSVIKLN